jgi:tetratricopeptide (TPR) repeat protein
MSVNASNSPQLVTVQAAKPRRSSWVGIFARSVVRWILQGFDRIWHLIFVVILAGIIVALIQNSLISLLQTGSLSATDPRSWFVAEPFVQNPLNLMYVILPLVLLGMLAYVAHRVSHRPEDHFDPELRDRYGIAAASDVKPRHIADYVEEVYIPRRLKDTGEEADPAAVSALQQAIENSRGTSHTGTKGICVYGRPLLGTTRLWWEAMKTSFRAMRKKGQEWTFIDWPTDPQRIGVLLDGLRKSHAKVVLALDDLSKYTEGQSVSQLNSLPGLLSDYGIPYIIVATCPDEGELGPVHAAFESLMAQAQLQPIQLADISREQAQRLVTELRGKNREVHLDASFDGTPGSIALAVGSMRDRYRQLPDKAKVMLKTVKLLRAAGIRPYTSRRVISAAIDLFGFREVDWQTSFNALNGTGFLGMGLPTEDGQVTVEPATDVYLTVAVPDYQDDETLLRGDLIRLGSTLERTDDTKGLLRLGDALRKHNEFEQAEECYRAVLSKYTTTNAPFEWALAQYGLGLVLEHRITTTQAQPTPDLLAEAEECFRKALTVINRQDDPASWAGAYRGLAAVLRREAPTTSTRTRIRLLEQAANATRQMLKVVTKEQDPIAWADTQLSLGAVLYFQARMEPSADSRRYMLDKSMKSYESALSVLSSTGSPETWARGQRGLAETLVARADFSATEGRAKNLRRAVAAFRDALTTPTVEWLPADIGEMQVALGTALHDLSKQAPAGEQVELLGQSVAAFRTAQDGFATDQYAVERADSACKLAEASVRWAGLVAGLDHAMALSQAISAYEEALSALGRKGTVEERDDVRLRMAQLYWQRADEVPGANGGSACEDLKKLLSHIDTVLSHDAVVKNKNSALYRQASKYKRDATARMRQLGCGGQAVGVPASGSSSRSKGVLNDVK